MHVGDNVTHNYCLNTPFQLSTQQDSDANSNPYLKSPFKLNKEKDSTSNNNPLQQTDLNSNQVCNDPLTLKNDDSNSDLDLEQDPTLALAEYYNDDSNSDLDLEQDPTLALAEYYTESNKEVNNNPPTIEIHNNSLNLEIFFNLERSKLQDYINFIGSCLNANINIGSTFEIINSTYQLFLLFPNDTKYSNLTTFLETFPSHYFHNDQSWENTNLYRVILSSDKTTKILGKTENSSLYLQYLYLNQVSTPHYSPIL